MLGALAHDLLAGGRLLLLPTAALILFVLLFALVIVWTLGRGDDELERAARLPLDDQPLATDERPR